MNPPPELLLFENFDGDWNRYEEELSRVFIEEIVRGNLRFKNQPVRCSRNPETKGRWAAFWHLIQEGYPEDERKPDLRRCERLPWIPWMVRSVGGHPKIDEWKNTRKGETNALLWYCEKYLVVLSQRKNYWLLKTAYVTRGKQRIRRLRKERDNYTENI